MKSNLMRFATILALSAAAISGVNNFLTKIAVTSVKDPIVYTTLKNTLVAVFLLGIILGIKKFAEIANLKKKQFLNLIAIGVIGGSIPFALYFIGLSQTSALNASLIHKTLFLWVALLAIITLKERLSPLQWIGVLIIFWANLMVGGFTGFKYNSGELMILAATIFWAIETILAKNILKDISSTTVASARMILGSLILWLIVFWKGGGGAVLELNSIQWSWTILTSILLFGYVLTWYTALKYAPASYVATILVPATLITNFLSALFITHAFSGQEIINAALYLIGITLVIIFTKRLAEKTNYRKQSRALSI